MICDIIDLTKIALLVIMSHVSWSAGKNHIKCCGRNKKAGMRGRGVLWEVVSVSTALGELDYLKVTFLADKWNKKQLIIQKKWFVLLWLFYSI